MQCTRYTLAGGRAFRAVNQRGEVSPTLHCAVLPCGGDGMALLALATAEELVPASVLVTNAGASVCAACLLYSVVARTVVRFICHDWMLDCAIESPFKVASLVFGHWVGLRSDFFR